MEEPIENMANPAARSFSDGPKKTINSEPKILTDPCKDCDLRDCCKPLDPCGKVLHAIYYPKPPHADYQFFSDLEELRLYRKEMGYD